MAANGGGSGNPVAFSIDSSSGAGACSISGAVVSFTGIGTCVIDANQAGNSDYEPATQAQQQLTIGYTRTITGTYHGPLTINAGQALRLAPGATIRGRVTVQPGGALNVDDATINGPLRSRGASAIRVCHATIAGPTAINDSTGPVVVGDDDGNTPCQGNALTGPVRITKNTAGVEFDTNTVNGPLTITGNTGTLRPPDSGTVDATGNTVSGPVNVQH